MKDYLAHATEYYVDASGRPARQVENIKLAMKPLQDICPTLPADEFGPLTLKNVRQAMIDAVRSRKVGKRIKAVQRLSRKVINQRVNIIRRMFKWAASEQRVPAHVYQALRTVDGLRRGRSGARETSPVGLAPEANVYAILPYANPTDLCIERSTAVERTHQFIAAGLSRRIRTPAATGGSALR